MSAFMIRVNASEATAIIESILKMHSSMPQPASGSTRIVIDANEYHRDFLNKIRVCTLTYVKHNGEPVFRYTIRVQPGDEHAMIGYEGEERDFGYGDVGNLHGMKTNVKMNGTVDAGGFHPTY